MKYLSNKNGFLGVDNKFNFRERVVIVPFGLEKTVSYGGGTKNGPKEIIKASHQVELYDEELNCEPYKKIGIKTLKPWSANFLAVDLPIFLAPPVITATLSFEKFLSNCLRF